MLCLLQMEFKCTMNEGKMQAHPQHKPQLLTNLWTNLISHSTLHLISKHKTSPLFNWQKAVFLEPTGPFFLKLRVFRQEIHSSLIWLTQALLLWAPPRVPSLPALQLTQNLRQFNSPSGTEIRPIRSVKEQPSSKDRSIPSVNKSLTVVK